LSNFPHTYIIFSQLAQILAIEYLESQMRNSQMYLLGLL